MDWKNFIGSVAPWLGAALGGPLGSAAVAVAADAFGLDDKTEEGLKKLITGNQATPEQMLALKTADQAFAVKMQELGYANVKDLETLTMQDRDSARKREMEVKDHVPRNLAYAVTLGFFGVLAFMMFATVPERSRDILNIMLGTLGTSWTAIVSYYFGSTAGSKAKSDLLAKATIPTEETK